MLKTFRIRVLMSSKREPVIGEVTVSAIKNVENAFRRYGHVILDYMEIEPNIEVVKKRLPLYIMEV